MVEEAWETLQKSYVYYKGRPVGTLAAMDPTVEALNYNQRFSLSNETSQCWWRSRDSKEFLLKTLHLQGWEKRIDNFTLGGVMPASFKVLYESHRQKETLVANFGGSAIGRVALVDSGFWWIILLRSHIPSARMIVHFQKCLSMIDRRMEIYGYPIEIQALFYFALRCSRRMLKPERDGKELIKRIDKRITALSYHIQNY
ncbi:hypothetical protein V6N13_071211 [Hibiscus sabdariffa]